ncbi:MAG: division/cell wall cluster transcriptional repressor MraZ [Spirochaetes bacterium]|nr:division/cell wall cluster transcriptional repressor MraZ [Spirochaetota bacterium]
MEWFFCGEYFNTLDEKGRIAFPSKLRSVLDGEELWITKGMGGDRSLLLYSPEEWEKTIKEIESHSNIYSANTRRLYRMFIAPAQKVSIDKNGRIAVPQSLREYAGLKKDCVFLGMNRMIELWDADAFTDYQQASEDDSNIFEDLSKMIDGSLHE